MIQYGRVGKYYSKSTGRTLGYEQELYHNGLDEFRHLKGAERHVLEGKIAQQLATWEKKWARYQEKLRREREAEEIRRKKAKAAADIEAKQRSAEKQTAEAQSNIDRVKGILHHTLDVDDAVDWGSLKNRTEFVDKTLQDPVLVLDKKGRPDSFVESVAPTRPKVDDFQIEISFWQILFGQKKKLLDKQAEKYDAATAKWKKNVTSSKRENVRRQAMLAERQTQWDKRKNAHDTKKQRFNSLVDEFDRKYREKDTEAIVEYCELVLHNSEYPDSFPKDYELQYNPQNGIVVVEYALPRQRDIPTLLSVSYVKSRDETKEKHISAVEVRRLYDATLYQIALRTIHELFEADVVEAISSIVFNGIVTDINPSTGKSQTNCIMSIQASKKDFLDLDLANVDPKKCFRALKGVSGAKLSELSPIPPVLSLDRSDDRFVDGRDISNNMDNSTNLAAMDWEDFEHLVRELFEKEFAQHGAEVRVTKASADGGVDAVVFDPDPIRGGKIVIQAKRYTNTVGVAAVRDLYGTVMNEGASKGILVTTSDFGADSYNFANGKPLSLLNGSNLLHLLEKHGHRAKIDLAEAKSLQKEA